MADGDVTNSDVTNSDVATGDLPRPLAGDRDGWRAYWAALGQPWRTEPEIGAERQAYLDALRAATKTSAVPPFLGISLDRADIEWLLATHEDQGMTGPVDRSDERQREINRLGLRLHGADLRGADLSGLPLDCLVAEVVTSATEPLPYRRIQGDPLEGGAPLLLDGANLRDTHLRGAYLRGAHLHGADLTGADLRAHLNEADLTDANLTGANLSYAVLEKANLVGATLTGSNLFHVNAWDAQFTRTHLDGLDLRQASCGKAHFEDADLRGAHLEGADLSNAFLDRADLRGAYLNQVLSPLRRDDLAGATLGGAHLDGTLLAGAYIEGINLGYITSAFPWEAFAETLSTPEEVQAARRTPALDPAERERWRAHWDAQGQPWRTQPEISAERQVALAERCAIPADYPMASYPFLALDPPLTRADVEWLLATHDDGRGYVGPVDWADEAQRERVGLDLRGADLRYLDLSGLPLTRMVAGLTSEEYTALVKSPGTGVRIPYNVLDIWRVHLDGATLRGAQLQGAQLRQGWLERADLTGADLTGANLEKTILRWATLDGACLDETNLDSVQGAMTQCDRATFRKANCYSAILARASLSGADFQDAKGSYLDFTRAHLDGAIFDGASLSAAIFDHATAREARFERLYASGSRWQAQHADFTRARFAGSVFDAADFTDASLEDVDMTGVGFDDCNFTSARLRRARLDGATFKHNTYAPADRAPLLTGADLEGASLVGAKIHQVDLTRARLVAANMEGASLSDSNLTDVDASGANLRGVTLDATTTLDGLRLGDPTHGVAMLGGVRWGDADISAVQWASLPRLGDERLLDRRAADGESKDGAARRKDLDDVFRAYSAVSVLLNTQGLNEQAEVYAYRMRVLQRRLAFQRRRFGQWFFALLLEVLTGYGYRLGRILVAYLGIVLTCAAAYFALGHLPGMVASAHLSLPSAVLVSITAFHGRVFNEPFAAGSPQVWVTAIEAVFGLVIEGVFVAMLTKKFFGQ